MSKRSPHMARIIRQYVVVRDFTGHRLDELKLRQGEIVLGAERFNDGWIRGIRIRDWAIGFFPCSVIRSMGEDSTRTRVAEELLATEESYLEQLLILDQHFAAPLKTFTIISPEEFGTIFGTIEPLVGLSRDFCSQLKERFVTWDHLESKLGDLFLQLAPFFKLFGSHAIGYTSALEIQRRLKHNGKFTSFITEAEANSGHILSALLIIPIQRIPRYELLLKELLKHTDKDHPDYGDLTLALTKIQTVASGINESIRAIENELQLIILTKRFPHDQLHLINESRQFNSLRLKASRTQSMRAVKDNRKWLPHSRTVSVPALMYMAQSDDRLKLLDFGPRRVIREGAVQIIKPESRETTERYLVLLNDLILISQSVSKTKPQYKLKDRSLLAQVWIEDSQNCDDELSDRALVLGTPSTLHKIIFSSTEDKKQWFEDLSKYVCEQKQAAIYMLKGLGIPNQVMLSCNMKCRVDYRGLDDFELKLKHGSEVNVYGVIGDDGKWRPSLFPDGDEVMEFTWWYGDVGKSVGWFPCGCLMEADKAMAEIELSELKQLPMKQFLSVRKKFAEWTGNTFERLLDPVVKVHGTDNSYKALIIPDSATAADVIRIYLSRKSCIETNETVSWSLREVSADKSVNILLSPDAVLPKRIDSWGCCKDKMSFQLEEQAGSED